MYETNCTSGAFRHHTSSSYLFPTPGTHLARRTGLLPRVDHDRGCMDFFLILHAILSTLPSCLDGLWFFQPECRDAPSTRRFFSLPLLVQTVVSSHFFHRSGLSVDPFIPFSQVRRLSYHQSSLSLNSTSINITHS